MPARAFDVGPAEGGFIIAVYSREAAPRRVEGLEVGSLPRLDVVAETTLR